MKVEEFVNEERDLLIMLLGLTGVKFKIGLTDGYNEARLRLSSMDLREREIEEIMLYDFELDLIIDRLNSIGYFLDRYDNDRAVFRQPEEE